MNLLRQAMTVLVTVLTIAVLVAVISPKTAHAIAAALVQIEPGTTTHVGQNESQLVSLFCNGHPYCFAISPEGIPSLTAYVVPAGYTLIVTDWQFVDNAGIGQPGVVYVDYLVVGGNIVAAGTGVADALGNYANSEKYTTGIRLGSGTTVIDNVANGIQGYAFIQGYLVPN